MPHRSRRDRNAPRRRRYRDRREEDFATRLVSLSLLVAAATWIATPDIASLWTHGTLAPDTRHIREAAAYYARCDDARMAGAAPMRRGEPGYREGLDGDADGIACEPYR